LEVISQWVKDRGDRQIVVENFQIVMKQHIEKRKRTAFSELFEFSVLCKKHKTEGVARISESAGTTTLMLYDNFENIVMRIMQRHL
jgi:hypothetical protein